MLVVAQFVDNLPLPSMKVPPKRKGNHAPELFLARITPPQ